MYEIWSVGHKPFKNITNAKVSNYSWVYNLQNLKPVAVKFNNS